MAKQHNNRVKFYKSKKHRKSQNTDLTSSPSHAAFKRFIQSTPKSSKNCKLDILSLIYGKLKTLERKWQDKNK